ncbi:MAG: phytoene desaturase family protein [Zavarzinella sp.]
MDKKVKYDAIIIGAGPGGLAAALLLAHAGLKVRIFERLPRVGGRCSAIEADGFRFDLGPTFFLYPLVLERIYRRIGRNLRAEVPMVRLDPQYRLVFGEGGELRCSSDITRMAEELATMAPADAANLQRYMSENRHKLASFRPALERPFLKWTDLLSWDLIKLLPILRPWASVEGDLRRYFQDPRTRLAFSFQSKYLGMSPFQCPSLFTILSFLEYEYGVHHPIGGCSAVSEAMASLAEDMGVEISCGESVEQILWEGNKAVGVTTSSGSYATNDLVINGDFSRMMHRLVPDHLRKRWKERSIAKKKYSCSTFMMYLGIDGCYDQLDHHTIYTSAKYEENLADIDAGRLTKDCSFYVQNASVTDSTLAPEGKSTLYVLAPVPNLRAGVNWQAETTAFRNNLMEQMQKVGIKDLQNRIRYEKIVTPQDWDVAYEVHHGATFNLAHNLKQMLHLRPRNRFEDLQSVYLVGGGTHPGSGLPVIYESARITARLMLQDRGMKTDWLEENETDELNNDHMLLKDAVG